MACSNVPPPCVYAHDAHPADPCSRIAGLHTQFVDDQRSWGYTLKPRAKFVVLPHVHVARSCPILKHGATPPPASDTEPHTQHTDRQCTGSQWHSARRR